MCQDLIGLNEDYGYEAEVNIFLTLEYFGIVICTYKDIKTKTRHQFSYIII